MTAAPATPADPAVQAAPTRRSSVHADHRSAPAPLAAFHGEPPPAPDWYHAAMAQAPERGFAPVQGAPIEWLAWGRVGDPAVLLVHGNAAHADWFSFIGPLLMPGRRVVALSLSGMGASGWRTQYGMAQWADEVLGVAQATGCFAAPVAPTVVAHSFGGLVLATGAARYGERLARAVIVDSPLRAPVRDNWQWHRDRVHHIRTGRVFATEAQALARFKLLPPQDCAHLYLLDHIARRALKPTTGPDGRPGWVWRTDPFLFRHYDYGDPWRSLGAARCPVVLVRGGRSRLISPRTLERQSGQVPGGALLREVADADHHVMLDQPQGFADLVADLVPARAE